MGSYSVRRFPPDLRVARLKLQEIESRNFFIQWAMTFRAVCKDLSGIVLNAGAIQWRYRRGVFLVDRGRKPKDNVKLRAGLVATQ